MEELFSKYGGMAFWAEFINTFYDRATTDEVIRDFFAGKDVNKIKEMQVSLLEMTLTGRHFPDDMMYHAHKSLNVNDVHFRRFMELYERALLDLDVDPPDATLMIEALLGYKKQVVLDS